MPRDKLDISMAPGAATGRPDGERWLSGPLMWKPTRQRESAPCKSTMSKNQGTIPIWKIATARTIFMHWKKIIKNNCKQQQVQLLDDSCLSKMSHVRCFFINWWTRFFYILTYFCIHWLMRSAACSTFYVTINMTDHNCDNEVAHTHTHNHSLPAVGDVVVRAPDSARAGGKKVAGYNSEPDREHLYVAASSIKSGAQFNLDLWNSAVWPLGSIYFDAHTSQKKKHRVDSNCHAACLKPEGG